MQSLLLETYVASILTIICCVLSILMAAFNIVWAIISVCRKDEKNKISKLLLGIAISGALILLFVAIRMYQNDLIEKLGPDAKIPDYMYLIFIVVEIIAECVYGFSFHLFNIKSIEENNEKENIKQPNKEIKKDIEVKTKENTDETKI